MARAYELNRNQPPSGEDIQLRPADPLPAAQRIRCSARRPSLDSQDLQRKKQDLFLLSISNGSRQNSNALEQYIVPTQTERRRQSVRRGGPSLSATGPGDPIKSMIQNPRPMIPSPTLMCVHSSPAQCDSGQSSESGHAKDFRQSHRRAASLLCPSRTFRALRISGNTFPITSSRQQTTVKQQALTAKVDQLFGPNRLAARYSYTSNVALRRNTMRPPSPGSKLPAADTTDRSRSQKSSARMPSMWRISACSTTMTSADRCRSLESSRRWDCLPTRTQSVSAQLLLELFKRRRRTTITGLGIDRDNPQDYPDQTITGSDQFSYNRGNHQMKFGFEVDNSRITTFEIGQPGGNYGFGGNFTGLKTERITARVTELTTYGGQ